MKVFFALNLFLLSFTAYALGQSNTACRPQLPIVVNYKIQHSAQCTTAKPPPFDATITVDPYSNALRVMERAVNIGPTYRFNASYFGDTLGYLISDIDGIGAASGSSCYWVLCIQYLNGTITQSSLGVSNFFIPGDGYTIILSLEK